jgi:hypothetical protein
MPRQTWIPDQLVRFGLKVVEVDGWRDRGKSSFDPRGVVCHHTAGAATGDRPSFRVCVNGRGDLPGPLCNVFVSRSGVAFVVAAGRANHAGRGGFRGLEGNSSVLGIEVESTGRGERWSPELLNAYYRVTAGLLAGIGRDASWACGHREWAPKRKTDPAGVDMDLFRNRVAVVLSPDPLEYVVRRGDTLWKISHKHRLTVDELRGLNGLDGDLIVPGQRLRVSRTSR